MLLIIALGAFVLAQWVRRGRQRQRVVALGHAGHELRVSVGPVPGYARFESPEKLVALKEPPIGDAELMRVELFLQRQRVRWVVQVRGQLAPTEEATREVIRWMRGVTARARLHVLALELYDGVTPQATFVYARDGRGWDGLESGVFVLAAPPAQAPFVQRAVEGTPSQPGQGWYVPSLEDVGPSRLA